MHAVQTCHACKSHLRGGIGQQQHNASMHSCTYATHTSQRCSILLRPFAQEPYMWSSVQGTIIRCTKDTNCHACMYPPTMQAHTHVLTWGPRLVPQCRIRPDSCAPPLPPRTQLPCPCCYPDHMSSDGPDDLNSHITQFLCISVFLHSALCPYSV